MATAPANRGGRCGDTARSGKGHEESDEGFVEHYYEEAEAMEILKADAALGLGDGRVMSCLLINLLPLLTRLIAAMARFLPAACGPVWNSALTGVLSVRLF